MKTPEEIAERRRELESALEVLDSEEQAWEELTREQRLTELAHKQVCAKSHNGYNDSCKYYEHSWASPSNTMKVWQQRVTNLMAALPEATDEQILTIFKTAQAPR